MRDAFEVMGGGGGARKEPATAHAHQAPGEAACGGTTRRDFLKVLGITGAGATAFGCGPPDMGGKLLPYLIQHEEITPGRNTIYATALGGAPEPLGIHAVVRDGRVIKLEGNPEFPTNRGRLSALAQSALQDLYDPDRVPNPLKRSGGPGADAADPRQRFENAAWDDAIAAAGIAVGGGGTVLLTGAVTGTSARFYAQWAEAMGAEHIAYEAFEFAPVREAHRIAFGRAVIPSYDLEAADRIICFGADFLATWLAPVELAVRFAAAREIESGRHAKFTFVGPRLSLTGSNADEWLSVRSGSEGPVALAVAREVAARRGDGDLAARLAEYTAETVAERAGLPADRIRDLGEELASADAPVALPPGTEAQGPDATQVHLAVAILNAACGAIGNTVNLVTGPIRGASATFAEMRDLIERMNGGEVRTLVVADANPAFTLPAASGFVEAMGRVPNLISIGSHLDETAAAAGWILPAHHPLESWGDAEVRPGVRALAQPAMRPVFDTRQREDILMQIAKAADSSVDFGAPNFAGYLKAAWASDLAGALGSGFGEWWRQALRRGGVTLEPAPAEGPGAALTAEARDYRFEFAEPGEGTSLVVYPTVQFYDGRGANRSWMQELPDPLTKVVWSSWVELHPDTARTLGVAHGDVVRVRSEAGAVEAPVYVYRGLRPDTVALPIGQGHTAYGRAARGRGVNPLHLLPPRMDSASGSLAFAGVTVELTPTGTRARLVDTQGSDTDRGREISEILEIEEARSAVREHSIDLTELPDAAHDSDPNSPYRWGMTIDLNACTGCGACVTACHAENNIPTVGEDRVGAGREMSWLRVERYYEETADGGFQMVHQPMMCQHCGDAPCEPVCPVYATYHNPEGLNVQVYNRCVGTRYCSNNCPYKVRRFNWFRYDGFEYPLDLQLNPDVTVRSVGVMEKCTFCVQRINRARVAAKQEGRTIGDGEIVTACQQSCPTQAIVFGNLKDPDSRVSRIARGARGYRALDELGTRPAITYLADVTHARMAEGGEAPEDAEVEPAAGGAREGG
ncbi:MAG: 4Fe-4S dicluster domain-containing protein [Gemmatimonadota bacterium]